MLNPVFKSFVEKSPISVKARGMLERVLNPDQLNEWFDTTAKEQYTKDLLFSTIFDLAALGSVYGVDFVEKNVSGYYVANEIEGVYLGMMIVVGNNDWIVFRDMPPNELVRLLKNLGRKAKSSKYQKHPRGPKKPQPKRIAVKTKPHVSTAKILAERKK